MEISDFDKGLAIDIMKYILIAVGVFVLLIFLWVLIGTDFKETFQNVGKLFMFLGAFAVVTIVFGTLSKCSGDSNSPAPTEMYFRK